MLSGKPKSITVKNMGEMEIDAEADADSEIDVIVNSEDEDAENVMLDETTEENNMMEESNIRQESSNAEEESNDLDVYFQNSGENELNRNTFGPNDSSSVGAELSTAYDNPLPKESCRDCIDFSKNKQRKYNSKDYLPQDINDEWFETDFSNAKYQVNDDKLINTDKYVVGINTVGQSLKNPSYDIRGTIPNPKITVSPWNQSTIEPDFNIKSII